MLMVATGFSQTIGFTNIISLGSIPTNMLGEVPMGDPSPMGFLPPTPDTNTGFAELTNVQYMAINFVGGDFNGNGFYLTNIPMSGVTGLSSSLTQISNHLDNLQANVIVISNDLNTTELNVTTISNRQNSISNQLFTLQSNVGAISNDLDTTELNVTTISNRQNSISNQLFTLQSNVGAISNDLDTTELNVTTISNRQNSISNQLFTLQSNVGAISNDLDTTELNVTSISNRVDILETNKLSSNQWSLADSTTNYFKKKDMGHYNYSEMVYVANDPTQCQITARAYFPSTNVVSTQRFNITFNTNRASVELNAIPALDIVASNITSSGIITGNYFAGNGGGLTNITALTDTNKLSSNQWSLADSTTNYLPSNQWILADSTTNYALRTAVVSISNAVDVLTTNKLSSNQWSIADSTTNYALRTAVVSISNAVDILTTNKLSSNQWSLADSTTNYLPSNQWLLADSTTNYALRTAVESISNAVDILTTNKLSSNQWFLADSTTNYALRTAVVSISNSVDVLITNKLSSNQWSLADSTTNYALRTVIVSISNAVDVLTTNKLSSNQWSLADSTTNYLPSNQWISADSTTNYTMRQWSTAISNDLDTAELGLTYVSNKVSGIDIISNSLISVSNDLDTLELGVTSISNLLDNATNWISVISNNLDTTELNVTSISNLLDNATNWLTILSNTVLTSTLPLDLTNWVTSISNEVDLLATNKLYSNQWALADSTTNYMQRNTQIDSNLLYTAALTNVLQKTGDTASGPLYTTIDFTTNAPAANEIPSAGWVRTLFNSGNLLYATTNISTINSNLFELHTVSPTGKYTNTYASVTNNQYIAASISTQKYTRINGPATVAVYLSQIDNGAANSLTCEPELYYTYDGTNLLGDWISAIQPITTSTQIYNWVISFPDTVATNTDGFYVVPRMKVISANNAGVKFFAGSNVNSRIGFSVPALACDPTKLDSNTWMAADSTTNYMQRNLQVASNLVYTAYATNFLPSNQWSLADSTTNYMQRNTQISSNLVYTGLETNKLSSNQWSLADSTTNYCPQRVVGAGVTNSTLWIFNGTTQAIYRIQCGTQYVDQTFNW
jgi:chaperonin cofactor prefoldin